MVFDFEFVGHCLIFVRNGGYDSFTNFAQGHRSIQSGWYTPQHYLYRSDVSVSLINFNFGKKIDSGEDAQEEFGWKLVHGRS